MSNNYVIGSPVYAAQINAILARLARLSVQCPCTATHTVLNPMGYVSQGQKISQLPGVGGLTYLGTNMYGPTDLTKLCVVVPEYYAEPPGMGQQRTAYQCCSSFVASCTAGGNNITDTWSPVYNQQDSYQQAPIAHVYDCNVTSIGSGNYGLCHVLLTTQMQGNYGYEQDVAPYIAWVQWSGVPGVPEGGGDEA